MCCHPRNRFDSFRSVSILAGAFVFCLGALPASAQANQPAPPNASPSQAVEQPGNTQNPQDAAQTGVSVPPTLTVPAGTVISVRTTQWLSSDQNHPGDTFSATLDQPVVASGWVVARRGQTVIGRIAVAEKASRGKGVSKLGLEITDLTLVDGQQFPVTTQLQSTSAGNSPRDPSRAVATVGTTTVIGTIIGGVAGGGEGAAIGAVAGAAGGIAAIMSTPGRPTVISPETLLTFRSESPLAISTEKGQVAFHPVSQGDYVRADQDAYASRPRHVVGGGPTYPPPNYYYDGCYGWGWGCYPAPPLYLGFYGGHGFGPRFGGFRGFRR